MRLFYVSFVHPLSHSIIFWNLRSYNDLNWGMLSVVVPKSRNRFLALQGNRKETNEAVLEVACSFSPQLRSSSGPIYCGVSFRPTILSTYFVAVHRMVRSKSVLGLLSHFPEPAPVPLLCVGAADRSTCAITLPTYYKLCSRDKIWINCLYLLRF